MWMTQPLQIADKDGKPTGRWRMTATSDEGGGGPHGDTSHDHASAEEAQTCERCDEYMASVTGFPSRKRQAEDDEALDRSEYERLKKKYEGIEASAPAYADPNFKYDEATGSYRRVPPPRS